MKQYLTIIPRLLPAWRLAFSVGPSAGRGQGVAPPTAAPAAAGFQPVPSGVQGAPASREPTVPGARTVPCEAAAWPIAAPARRAHAWSRLPTPGVGAARATRAPGCGCRCLGRSVAPTATRAPARARTGLVPVPCSTECAGTHPWLGGR